MEVQGLRSRAESAERQEQVRQHGTTGRDPMVLKGQSGLPALVHGLRKALNARRWWAGAAPLAEADVYSSVPQRTLRDGSSWCSGCWPRQEAQSAESP